MLHKAAFKVALKAAPTTRKIHTAMPVWPWPGFPRVCMPVWSLRITIFPQRSKISNSVWQFPKQPSLHWLLHLFTKNKTKANVISNPFFTQDSCFEILQWSLVSYGSSYNLLSPKEESWQNRRQSQCAYWGWKYPPKSCVINLPLICKADIAMSCWRGVARVWDAKMQPLGTSHCSPQNFNKWNYERTWICHPVIHSSDFFKKQLSSMNTLNFSDAETKAG